MPPESGQRAEPHAHLRVLIVDDDPDVRSVLGACVEQREHATVTVGTMHEGLAALAKETFDVLVTDVLLPDGDGIVLVNEVARHHRGMHVVVVSGGGRFFGAGFFRPIAEMLGAVMVQKPFDAQDLVTAVESGHIARG